jgi:hypothetical protein
MSFTGDLEHLPIVDIIQLLHAARKSGTLSVHNQKGENQLVFRDGFIVSANNSRNTFRIGRILVEAKAITQEGLDQALAEQAAAGDRRKPLIATLLEQGLVNKEDAFKGLEILIEKTVLEVLIWEEGTFTFAVDEVNVSDEYRYFPEKMNREITLNSQNVLMEALRLYDEKKRDGELGQEFAGEEAAAVAAGPAESQGPAISADILGLADIDCLERRIPEVFTTLADPAPDPATLQRRKMLEAAPDLPVAEQEELVAFMLQFSRKADEERTPTGTTHALILFSADRLLTQALITICKYDGILAFATNEEQDLDMIIDQSLVKGMTPVILFDLPGAGESSPRISDLRRQKQERYPQAILLQLALPGDTPFTLDAIRAGVRAVLPRPLPNANERFAPALIDFLTALRACLSNLARDRGAGQVGELQHHCLAMKNLDEPREVAFSVLAFVASLCSRALILVVGRGELVADRGIGAGAPDGAEGSRALDFRVPLAEPSIFREVVERGRPFFGSSADPLLQASIFSAIGPPQETTILLLPVASFGKTRFLAYGDFGPNSAARMPLDLLEILAGQAGLVLENALYRKKLQKDSVPGL